MNMKRYLILALMVCISLAYVKSSEAYIGIDMSYSKASVVNKSTIEVKCVYVNGYGYLDIQFQWYGDYAAFIPVNYWVSSCGGSGGGSGCWTAVGYWIDSYTGNIWYYDNCGNYWDSYGHYGNSTCGQPGGICY